MRYAVCVAVIIGISSTGAVVAGEESTFLPDSDMGVGQPVAGAAQKRLVIPAEEWQAKQAEEGSLSARDDLTGKAAETIGEYRATREHFTSLEDRRRQAQLLAEIAESLAKCRESGGCLDSAPSRRMTTTTMPTAPDSASMSLSGSEEVVDIPMLESVIGNRGLFVTRYGRLYAAQGAVLPGDFRVVRVDLKEVVLNRKGVEYRVALKWDPQTGVEIESAGNMPVSGVVN